MSLSSLLIFVIDYLICVCFQTQVNTRKWLVEQSLKVPEVQQLEPQVFIYT